MQNTTMETRMAALEAMAAVHENQLEQLLGNGQPGVIAKIQEEIKDLGKTVRYLFIGIAVLIVLASSGPVSIKNILDLLKITK